MLKVQLWPILEVCKSVLFAPLFGNYQEVRILFTFLIPTAHIPVLLNILMFIWMYLALLQVYDKDDIWNGQKCICSFERFSMSIFDNIRSLDDALQKFQPSECLTHCLREVIVIQCFNFGLLKALPKKLNVVPNHTQEPFINNDDKTTNSPEAVCPKMLHYGISLQLNTS